MFTDLDAERGFKRGTSAVFDEARHPDQFIASRAMQVVVMSGGQLEPGAPVVERQLGKRTFSDELFSGAKYAGKIRSLVTIGKTCLDVFQSPRVMGESFHQAQHSGRNHGLARHIGTLSMTRLIRKWFA
jgi:hypothetical protein